MSSQGANSIEDIFDSSLNLEDAHYSEGYSVGYSDGLASGKDEGRQVGLKTGFEVGEELGFYRGCVDVWNAAILVEPTCFSSRVQKGIKQMDELLYWSTLDTPKPLGSRSLDSNLFLHQMKEHVRDYIGVACVPRDSKVKVWILIGSYQTSDQGQEFQG